jgi:hypothetical protein
MENLQTTNLLLLVLAVLGVLEALALIVLIAAGVLAVRRLIRAMQTIEREHVAPVASRVNGILDDVKETVSGVRAEVSRLRGFADFFRHRPPD